MIASARHSLHFARVGVLALAPTLLPAQFTVDGQLSTDPYGPPFAVQNTATSFGDNTDADTLVATGSELDALYARISGDSLYLLLTGNLETNFNKLELFIDSVAGGQNTLAATNPVLDFDALGTMAGLTFDAGFEADYFLTLGGGDAGSGITFFVNFAELYVDAANPGSTLYLGETGGGNTTFPVDLAGGAQIGINNSNTAGVSFTDVGNPAAVTTGVELRIPLSLIGDPAGAIKVTAFVNSESHNFLSNQVLPGIGAGLDTTHLGPPPINFSAIPGNQFATIASYDVETLEDAGPGSLRQAIANASPGSSLTIAPRLSGGTITLSSGQLLIDKDLTINASTLPGGLAIDAGGSSRVIEVPSGATVTLDSLTLTGGQAIAGGGIYSKGTLTVQNSTFWRNSAGPSSGGGIYSDGTLTVRNSTFTENDTDWIGGGIHNFGTLTVESSTLTGNSAALFGGGIYNSGTFTLESTIVAENTVSAVGGANPNIGGTSPSSSTNNLTSGNPRLLPLGYYSGPTQTMPPLPGSPAIDAGVPTTLPTDQRGLPRSTLTPDIGAAESGILIPGYNVVSETGDAIDGAGNGVSLREAILLAPAGSTITFDPSLDGATITLTNGQLLLDRDLTIDASGLIHGLTIDAQEISRVIQVTSETTVILDSLTLTGGSAVSGGGIYNEGTLTVQNATLSGNKASNSGGGIYNEGTLTVQNATLSGNSAVFFGGGIANEGTLTVRNATLSGNEALLGGGGTYNDGTFELHNSILSGNVTLDGSEIREGMSPDVSTSVSGVNLLGSLDFSGLTAGPNVLVGAADLAPLGHYGGPTQTMPPLPGSPAIDPLGGATSSTLLTDQRGLPRVIGGIVDIGAFEAGNPVAGFAVVSETGDAINGAESGVSLREAITFAPAGSTITFDPALDGATILLDGSELVIERNLEINGSSLPHGITIDAQGGSRVLKIASGISVTLDTLTVTGGKTSDNGGGILLSTSTLYLRNSTVSANTALIGGGISNSFGTLLATNVTLANNVATAFGGGLNSSLATNTLQNVTLVGNSAKIRGGGINSTDTLTLISTIVANNEAPAGADLNYTGSAYTHTVSLIGGDPLLAPLGDYGGPTPTMPPLPGSPAIDPAGGANSSTLTSDQRGLSRVISGIVDIGAVESGNAIPGFGIISETGDSIDGAGNGVSLREALLFAQAGATLTFDPGLDGETILLDGSELLIQKNLTIDASSLPAGLTIDAQGISRGMRVTPETTVILDSLTLTGGGADSGGGIYNQGTLTVQNATLSGNTANDYGGGIYNEGTLTVQNATLSGNTANDYGGGIYNEGTLTVQNATLSGNSVVIFVGGGIYNEGTLTVRNATISGNSAEGDGSGIYNSSSATLTLSNSIVAGNLPGESGAIPNIGGDPIESSINSLTSGDPLLAPLGHYGGPTQTMPPLPGSPAIDAGVPTTLLTDQRGFERIIGDAIDIGAVEAGNAIPGLVSAVVTTASDTFDGLDFNGISLREAIELAATGSTITFDPSLDGETITLSGTQFLIDRDLTIDASGLTDGLTIDGNDASRHFEITFGSTVVLTHLTLINGSADSGGSIRNRGTLTLHHSTLSGNTAENFSSSGFGSGGGIFNVGGTLSVHQSTLSGNTANRGGGIYNNNGTLSVHQSTLSGNSALNGGGGIFSYTSDANDTITSSTTLSHCTLVGNIATSSGGAIFNENGLTTLIHCTVSGNTAPANGGSGVASYGDFFTETVVKNSIIAGNNGSDLVFTDESANSFTSQGGNLIGSGNATDAFNQTGDLTSGDPLLAPLGHYGGPTQTMPPLPGSPAIDAGVPTTLLTDQRGLPRVVGGSVDIGAVETGNGLPTLTAPIVTNNTDEIDGLDFNGISLREAILLAAAGSTITFDPSLNGATITLGGTQFLIDRDFTIDASGLTNGLTIDAGDASRHFEIAFGSTVVLTHLTLTNGFASEGGSIFNSGTLTLHHSTLSGNTAGDIPISGFSGGGGIYNYFGTLSVHQSTLSGNSASNRGGGIFSFTSNVTGTITSSTTLEQCTLTDNTATDGGGAIHNENGLTRLIHCTVSGNTAPATGGSGVASFGDSLTKTVVKNSIIAGNNGSDLVFTDASANSFTSQGGNLIGSGNATDAFNQTGDLTSGDPLLAPLGAYGGPTQTMPPLPGSPAIDPAGGETSSDFATDQRGLSRVIGGIVDIGAFEAGNPVAGFAVVSETGDAINGAESGVSLREAITFAPAGSTITFDPALDGATILLDGSELVIERNLEIKGSSLPHGITIDAQGGSRVLNIASGISVTLDTLTVTGGKTSSGNGGGILLFQSTLYLRNSTVSANTALIGGGISNSFGTLLATNVTLSNNVATDFGGGLSSSLATNTLQNVTLVGNSAEIRGGGINSTDTLTLISTIVANNEALTGADLNYTGSAYTHTGSLIGGDPLLAPLGDYGGPTQTMPPLPGSPAIEGGILTVDTPLTDQIGNPRPSGPLPDLGAVEALPLGALGLVSADGDTIPDLLEGPDTAYPHLDPLADDSTVDTDGDGSTDAEELANMTDLFDGTDSFRVVAYRLADAWGPLSDPTTDPVVTITLSTFPGLSYAIEAGGTLLEGDYLEIPSATFTANDFEATLDLTLPPGSEFIRAKRED